MIAKAISKGAHGFSPNIPSVNEEAPASNQSHPHLELKNHNWMSCQIIVIAETTICNAHTLLDDRWLSY